MRFLLICFLLSLLFACNGKNNQQNNQQVTTLNLLNKTSKKLSFQSIQLVPLESKKDILFGNSSKLKFIINNNEFFVLAKESDQGVSIRPTHLANGRDSR